MVGVQLGELIDESASVLQCILALSLFILLSCIFWIFHLLRLLLLDEVAISPAHPFHIDCMPLSLF